MAETQLDNVLKERVHSRIRGVFNRITCDDGFNLSVQTGYGAYCSPRPDNFDSLTDLREGDVIGPFYAAEVGFPSERPEPWDVWETYCDDSEKPMGTVYGYVPADVIRALIELHGGEVYVAK